MHRRTFWRFVDEKETLLLGQWRFKDHLPELSLHQDNLDKQTCGDSWMKQFIQVLRVSESRTMQE